MERYFVSHFRRNSLGVRPKCFLNTRVKCCGYSKPRSSEVSEMVFSVVQIGSGSLHHEVADDGCGCLACSLTDKVAEVVRRKEQRQGNTAHYRSHQKTDHFQKYKQGTLHMVKDLKLPTMKPLDPETMKLIFKKQR